MTVDYADAISASDHSLTLSTFTAAGRYSFPRLEYSSLHPFGEALAGLARASGGLVKGSNAGSANAGAAFAANLGGGLDLDSSRRLSLRLVELVYLLTTFDNGSKNHQINFRPSTGIVLHFGDRKD